MQIRDLKRRHGSAVVSVWPPIWASSYGPGDKFAVGEEGVLVRVRRIGERLSLTMEYDGREHVGVLEWEAPPGIDEVEALFRGRIGSPIAAIGSLEVESRFGTSFHLQWNVRNPQADSWSPEQNLSVEHRRIVTPDEFRSGVVIEPEPWLVQRLIDHPEEMRHLSRRDFQVFVAELLDRLGLGVKIGPKGRDGGVDVFAEQHGDFGPELILVQCKHPDPGNKVDVETVRLLHYQVTMEHDGPEHIRGCGVPPPLSYGSDR